MPSDLYGDYAPRTPKDREHEHLLDSDTAGWNKLGLIYELESAGEMPEEVALSHILVVSQGNFQASFLLNGLREGRRLQIKWLWIYILLNLTIGLSFALPVFLLMRSPNLSEELSSSSATT